MSKSPTKHLKTGTLLQYRDPKDISFKIVVLKRSQKDCGQHNERARGQCRGCPGEVWSGLVIDAGTSSYELFSVEPNFCVTSSFFKEIPIENERANRKPNRR